MPLPKELQGKSAEDLIGMLNLGTQQKTMAVFVAISNQLSESLRELKSSIDKSAISSDKNAESNKRLSTMILILDIAFGIATLLGLYIVIFK